MNSKINIDRDTQDSFTALKRAARKARTLAKMTGTPFYVMRSGRIVNLNRAAPTRRRQTESSGRARKR